ncbi:MAG: protoheme IX farnesyltransferase [Chloroflexi bacterium]|nr:MAG: protoheme IX farnesyltransferase [Chloroflexota bacterium]
MEAEITRSIKTRVLSSLKAYLLVTKPPSVMLLVFTAIGGMIAATGASIRWPAFLLALTAITAGCAGANTITCYIDRDIDAIMERTRKRPLPQGRISPTGALIWGIILCGVALVLSASLNPVAFFWMLFGLFDNIVIYSLLSKRRTAWNIVLGSFSGGAPTVFGWAAMRGDTTLLPVLMAALVVLWTPSHIWSLAIRYRDDYARANVPMLPVVSKVEKVLRCIVSTAFLMVISSVLIYRLGNFGLIYAALAFPLGIAMLAVHIFLWFHPTPRNAWRMFKLTSPYLAAVFTGIIVDSVI